MATSTKKKPAKKGNNRLTIELLEAARDIHTSGLMTKAAHEEIALRLSKPPRRPARRA